MSEKNEEQKAAEIAAAEKKAKAEAAAAKKVAEQAEKKAAKDAATAAKAAAKAEAAAKKEAEKAAKLAEKEAKAAAKIKVKQPEQNGVTRPKPDTLCGKAWAIMDNLSDKLGSPTPIKDVLEIAEAEGLNAGNVKCEYNRWRKYYGITGRIVTPKAEPVTQPAEAVANSESGEAGAPV